jgi:hypothetical protein
MPIPTEILLIDENYLKNYSQVSGAVDFEYLVPSIITAQDVHIEAITGTDLIAKIKTDANAGTITGIYATILDTYLRRALMWWTLVEALPFLRMKIDNGTIVVRTSEDTQPVTDTELQSIRSEWRNKAEFYTKKLYDYIRANTESIPEYTSNTDPDRSPMAHKTAYVPMEISGSGNRLNSTEFEDIRRLPL